MAAPTRSKMERSSFCIHSALTGGSCSNKANANVENADQGYVDEVEGVDGNAKESRL